MKKYSKKKYIQADTYWQYVYLLAKPVLLFRRTLRYARSGEMLLDMIIAKRKILHDGIMIDGQLFRHEYSEYGQPEEPISFTTPVGWLSKGLRFWLGSDTIASSRKGGLYEQDR